MIVGVGIDVVDVARFGAVLQRTPSIRRRLFTEGEQDLPLESLAGRFAVKEALAKALGSPGGLAWTDAEVQRGEHGAPRLVVRGTVAACAARRGAEEFLVSISHDGGIATAIVLAQGSSRPTG
ncbi:holo-ACP synthase [Mobilicoccus pelagius]|uniref:Holo-[acyl-carrier-protein] synthase n=1 Tax=Mobilicoccus pelagius NBRC 104925 TaxID=1089455 RepID=H5UQE7_9MICO|nr:holo-ACP synthase [Mobilicoccus pelagius]GAB47955.1 holo-[acyl-carrier-protein] synthase [Mobilicoccus pelagius NBRC 104925]